MAPRMLHRHTITLESGPEASGKAADWARVHAEQAGLDEDKTYALDLTVVEMVTNIVDYSYRGAAGEIRLDLDVGPAAAVLKIRDRGPAFDPLAVPPPVKPRSVEEATIGGFGIHLVRSMSNGCEYERREGQNVLTVYFGARE
jgi:anti-sigma regulatory factor (Ser/Thr protein kinase)